MNDNSAPKTLKELAISWNQGGIQKKELIQKIKEIEYPKRHQAQNGDVWYEGKLDNTVISVVDLVLTGDLSDDKVGEFLSIIEESVLSE